MIIYFIAFLVMAIMFLVLAVTEWIYPLHNKIHLGYYFEKNASIAGYIFFSLLYTVAFVCFMFAAQNIVGRIT